MTTQEALTSQALAKAVRSSTRKAKRKEFLAHPLANLGGSFSRFSGSSRSTGW